MLGPPLGYFLFGLTPEDGHGPYAHTPPASGIHSGAASVRLASLAFRRRRLGLGSMSILAFGRRMIPTVRPGLPSLACAASTTGPTSFRPTVPDMVIRYLIPPSEQLTRKDAEFDELHHQCSYERLERKLSKIYPSGGVKNADYFFVIDLSAYTAGNTYAPGIWMTAGRR